MRKTIGIMILLFFAGVLNAGVSDEDLYCPLLQNTRWTYNVHNKTITEQPDYERYVEVNGTEIYDGLSYFSYYSPDADGKYLMRKDEKGVYIKAARYAVPFLSFIHFDIIFNPPVYAIKFPLHKGDTWRYDGVATINAIFLNFPTKISADCTHMGLETIDVCGRSTTAYKLYGVLNRQGVDKPFIANWWFGKGVGLAKYESEKVILTLKRIEAIPDAAGNTTQAGAKTPK